jgi:hypothetical protein
MSDVANFSLMLRTALQDDQTAAALINAFKPLIIEQTNDIKEEMKIIKQENAAHGKKIDALEKHVTELQQKGDELAKENSCLSQALQQQQRFLEGVDYDKRRNNIIVTGIPEQAQLTRNEGPAATTDEEKVLLVMTEIGHQTVEIAKIQRLGKVQPGPTPRPRPIKVELKYANERGNLLRDTNKLKLAGEMMKRIYVKRDTHPGITREIKRLKDVEKREKEKPENQGRNVKYDWKERCVMVDSAIVDKFQPTFF